MQKWVFCSGSDVPGTTYLPPHPPTILGSGQRSSGSPSSRPREGRPKVSPSVVSGGRPLPPGGVRSGDVDVVSESRSSWSGPTSEGPDAPVGVGQRKGHVRYGQKFRGGGRGSTEDRDGSCRVRCVGPDARRRASANEARTPEDRDSGWGEGVGTRRDSTVGLGESQEAGQRAPGLSSRDPGDGRGGTEVESLTSDPRGTRWTQTLCVRLGPLSGAGEGSLPVRDQLAPRLFKRKIVFCIGNRDLTVRWRDGIRHFYIKKIIVSNETSILLLFIYSSTSHFSDVISSDLYNVYGSK